MVTLKDTPKPGVYEYHETHVVWPTQRCNFSNGASMKWAVPVDDHNTRWFTVDFYRYVDGKPTSAALRALNAPMPSIGRAENLPRDWWQQVGAWWNLGHPWRQGNLWEDESFQGTAAVPERNGFPDWERWHLASSDRCVIVNHTVCREQVERVRQGLDPIGVVRDPKEDGLLHIPADEFHVHGWDEGMRLYNMTPEERYEMALSDLAEVQARRR